MGLPALFYHGLSTYDLVVKSARADRRCEPRRLVSCCRCEPCRLVVVGVVVDVMVLSAHHRKLGLGSQRRDPYRFGPASPRSRRGCRRCVCVVLLSAGTQRTVSSLFRVRIREKISIDAMAKRWPGPMVSVLILSIATVESKRVNLWPLSAATIPSGVDRKAPRLVLPIRLMAAWCSSSSFSCRSR